MNKQILTEHYQRNFDMLVKRAANRVGSFWAEDVVQSSFERALKYLDSFNPDIKPFEAWFTTIFNNTCKDYRKINAGHFVEVEEEHWIDEDPIKIDDLLKEFNRATKSVNPNHRQVLYCSLILGYKDKQTAAITGESIFNVRQIRARFKAKEA